ncbi:HD domain-containing protein [Bacteroidota bacterium]
MCAVETNKHKIINDPVYGFIKISSAELFDIVEHPFFQRLRRIKQLGLTNFVYPGATHTRFQHALGSYHLMGLAMQVLRTKGVEITPDEEEAALSAILLHDIGHGPFSHALEESIIEGLHHEELSLLFIHALNKEFGGRLDLAISIFTGQYHKQFLHQLISGQLDMDRLDYLKRDSFFTGVTEGVIGSDRIVRMLNVVNDKLVVDHKGIYSIEKFLIARRLMYWQVYLHKTVLSSEILLLNILNRAKQLALEGVELFSTPALSQFLYRPVSREDFFGKETLPGSVPQINPGIKKNLEDFARLDDNDIIASTKVWSDHSDKVLSILSSKLMNRSLYRIEIQNDEFSQEYVENIKNAVGRLHKLEEKDIKFLVYQGSISNNAYSSEDEQIQILYHGGVLKDIAEASDMLDISVLSKTVKKYFLCYPKDALDSTP